MTTQVCGRASLLAYNKGHSAVEVMAALNRDSSSWAKLQSEGLSPCFSVVEGDLSTSHGPLSPVASAK